MSTLTNEYNQIKEYIKGESKKIFNLQDKNENSQLINSNIKKSRTKYITLNVKHFLQKIRIQIIQFILRR